MTKNHHIKHLQLNKKTEASNKDSDIVNGTVRSRPQGMTDSRWSEMSMQEKIKFWNRESNNGIKVLHTTVSNEIIPKAKELNISPRQIEALQRNVDAL